MRYILVTHIPFALTSDGAYAVNELWGWDLKAHLGVFSDLHIFAPMDLYNRNKFVYTFPKNSITFHPLPNFKKTVQFLIKSPKILYTFHKDIKKEDIVHSTGTAYPPLGLMANILCLFKGCKKRIVVFDADFISDLELRINLEKNLIKKLFLLTIKNFYSLVFKFCITHSPLTFVVGETLYERYKNYGNVVKIYASWVKEKDIISSIHLKEKIETFQKENEIKLCFAASLTPKKNPICAIEAAKFLKERGIPVTLHILGEGPMKQKLKELAEKYDLSNYVTFKGLVPYGKPFYETLRKYDAILIPNLSGEQPRIIFDAMANGVVVIGSDTKSFSVILSNINGLLCDPRDPESFALAVEKLYKYKDKKSVEKLIYAGIKTVRENTIESIHKKRMQIINNVFSKNDRGV